MSGLKILPLRVIKNKKDFYTLCNTFQNKKGTEEVSFLFKKALSFEELNKGRTYLIVNKEKILVAYFTIAIQYIEFSNKVSKTMKKKISKGSSSNTIPAFLIGHICKNERVKDKIGSLILNTALCIIKNASELVGGGIAYLDCIDNQDLCSFYEKQGFKFFQISQTSKLKQYYLPLY